MTGSFIWAGIALLFMTHVSSKLSTLHHHSRLPDAFGQIAEAAPLLLIGPFDANLRGVWLISKLPLLSF